MYALRIIYLWWWVTSIILILFIVVLDNVAEKILLQCPMIDNWKDKFSFGDNILIFYDVQKI